MKTITCRWILATVLLALAGCNYDVALTAKPTRKVDDRLLGVWQGGEEKDVMVVRKYDAETYVVSMDDDIYRAFHSDFAGVGFLSVQELEDDRQYVYLTTELSTDGRKLTLHMVSTKVVPEETKGRDALQKLIKANIANPGLFAGEPLVFTRKK